MSTGVEDSTEDEAVGQLLDEGSRAMAGERVMPGQPVRDPAAEERESVDAAVEAALMTTALSAGTPESRLTRMDRRLVLAGLAIVALMVFIAAIVALQRPAGPAPSAAGAGQPAAAASAGAPGSPGASPAAAASAPGGGAAGALPDSCRVPQDQVVPEVTELQWSTGSDGTFAGWRTLLHNRGSSDITVLSHSVDVGEASPGTPFNDWATNLWLVRPDGQASALTGFGGRVYCSIEPNLPTIFTESYFDRFVAIDGGACTNALRPLLAKATDVAAREALLGPLARQAPVPAQLEGFVCK